MRDKIIRMTNDNPYDPPQSPPTSVVSAFEDARLREKARALLHRRNSPAGGVYSWRALTGRKYLAFTVAYLLVIGGLWNLGSYLAAAAFAGFLAGRTLRDLRWIATIAREWETTKELIDWEKVQSLAGGEPESRTTAN